MTLALLLLKNIDQITDDKQVTSSRFVRTKCLKTTISKLLKFKLYHIAEIFAINSLWLSCSKHRPKEESSNFSCYIKIFLRFPVVNARVKMYVDSIY